MKKFFIITMIFELIFSQAKLSLAEGPDHEAAVGLTRGTFSHEGVDYVIEDGLIYIKKTDGTLIKADDETESADGGGDHNPSPLLKPTVDGEPGQGLSDIEHVDEDSEDPQPENMGYQGWDNDDDLDADRIENVLGSDVKDGYFNFEGDDYQVKDGVIYKQLSDGSFEQIDKPKDQEGNLYVFEEGLRWLSVDDEGILYINIAPKVWASINFGYDSDQITASGREILDIFGEALKRPSLENRILVIAGHTDGLGAADYNLKLSRKRALSVGHYLMETHNLPKERIILKGYGDTQPLADNSTDDGRAKNRRVEFSLLNS